MKAELLRAWYSEAIAVLEKREHQLIAHVLASVDKPGNNMELEALQNLTLTIMAIEAFRTRIALISD